MFGYAKELMAIGSEGEIGAVFSVWKDMSESDRKAWWDYMRREWGEYLQAGYAKLVHKKEGNPFYDPEYKGKRTPDYYA